MSCVRRERHYDNLVDQAIRQVAELEHATFADLRVDIHDHSVEDDLGRVVSEFFNGAGEFVNACLTVQLDGGRSS
jgi:hypothetical protein